jgi:Tol biopolymer transport system component
MTCEWVEGKLSSYLEDALDPQERGAVRAHLATCAQCQALLEDYRRDELLLRELTAPEPDPQMVERFFAAPEYIALKRRLENPPSLGRVWLMRGALPAAALLAVGLGAGLAVHARIGSGPSANASQTPNTIGAPPNFTYPLAAGQRLLFLRGGILWSAPESPANSAISASAPQQLTPTNAQVAAWSVSPASQGAGGKLVAWIDAKTGQLHLVRADGLTDTVVARVAPVGQTLSQATLSGLVWSPDGAQLAFVSQDTNGAYMMRVLTVSGPDTATGAQLSVPVALSGLVAAPVWSADSQALAWIASNGDGSASVWALHNGSATRVASQADPQVAQATVATLGWSGRAVTWATTNGGQITGVWAATPGATGVTRLTPSGSHYTAAALSANGTWLLAGQGALWRIHAGATAPTWSATLNGLLGQANRIIWAPDGQSTLVGSVGDSEPTQWGVWSPRSGLTQVTPSITTSVTPVWSDDSQRLVYVVYGGKLAFASLQNGRVTATQTGATITEQASLTWSADGSSLAIVGSQGVYIASSDGQLFTLITSNGPGASPAAWSTAG